MVLFYHKGREGLHKGHYYKTELSEAQFSRYFIIKKQHNNFCSSLKYSILGVSNKTKIIMLHGKSTKCFSEINIYFTSQEKAIMQISNLFAYLNLVTMKLNVTQPSQTRHYKRDLLYMLLLWAKMAFIPILLNRGTNLIFQELKAK